MSERPRDRKTPGDPVSDLEEAAELRREGGLPAPHGDFEVLMGEARQWSAQRSFDALREAVCVVASNLDLRSLVNQILDIAIQTVGAERGILFMGGGDQVLVPALARNIQGQEVVHLTSVSRTILRQAAGGQAVVTADATHDPELQAIPSVQMQQIRSVICLPMIVHGAPVGVIYVNAPTRTAAFPPHAHRFVEAFTSLAAVAMENARLHGETLRENARLRQQLSTQEAFGRLVTVSPVMTSLLQRASMVTPSDSPVVILGESGTGKELLARAIHEAGPRMLHSFVAYNCAAITRELMEDTFFGHVRGAFSGAVSASRGLFREANHGTFFLDEIADMDIGLQAKLLRVVEDGVVRPLGSQQEYHVNVRLITATSRDMRAAIQAGHFREELYHRLNVVELYLPPLRERPEDIPILVDHFLRKHGANRPEGRRVTVTPDALEYLQSLPWRGSNVRELENLVRRMLVLCEPGPVDAERLRSLKTTGPEEPPRPDAPPDPEPIATELESESAARREEERNRLRDALVRANGNQAKAARIARMTRGTFLRRLKEYGLE